MRKQQEIWLKEHTNTDTLPGMAAADPASAVEWFIGWLKANGVEPKGSAVDIGCGKGRNSVYLAALGYEVWGLEYIEPAIQTAKRLAEGRNVADRIHFILGEMDKHWDIEDDFFDIAVDSFSSIDIETREGRKTYRDEMHRTLKPGGYALVTVCSADDEWEKELIANSPGPEPNSTIWPQNGKFQKDYTEAELREFYRIFEIADLQAISKQTFKLGRNGTATNFRLVLRKK